MQNILINKETNIVEGILEWADGRKVDPKDYENNLIIYIEDKEKCLDSNKNYKYENGKFIEYKKEVKTQSINEKEMLLQEIANLKLENKRKDLIAKNLMKEVAEIKLNLKKEGN